VIYYIIALRDYGINLSTDTAPVKLLTTLPAPPELNYTDLLSFDVDLDYEPLKAPIVTTLKGKKKRKAVSSASKG
jgi:hypothetical protein